MFTQFEVYKNLIFVALTVGLVVGLYFYIDNLKSDITELKMTIKDMNVELANEKLQSSSYKSSLDTQTRQIQLLRANDKHMRELLLKWKNQPKEIRYKTIYRTKVVKSDECKDIKDRLEFVKSIDFNEL